MNLVQKIHADPELLGCVIEVGAGNPVATKLYAEAGASNTVVYSEVPNSKSYNQNQNAVHADVRAVSYEMAMAMLWGERVSSNFTFVNTCQIGPSCITHGWIAYRFKNRIGVFHYSFQKIDLTRSEYIEAIGNLGVQIIAAKNQEPVINGLIDQIYRVEYVNDDPLELNMKPDIWAALENLALASDVDDQMIVLQRNEQGQITFGRLEDYYRGQSDITIYKGSFNPLQTAHVELSQIMDEQFPDAPNMYSISVNTHEKGSAGIADLYYRIHAILLDTGKPIVLNKKPLFSDFTKFLRDRGYKQGVNYACGSDTIYRVLKLGYGIHETDFNTINHEWIKFLYDNLGVKYYYRNRDGYELPEIGACNNFKPLGVKSNPISSTTIREWVELGNWSSVQNNVLSNTFKILHDEEFRKSL